MNKMKKFYAVKKEIQSVNIENMGGKNHKMISSFLINTLYLTKESLCDEQRLFIDGNLFL
jgi:hypothetical protein